MQGARSFPGQEARSHTLQWKDPACRSYDLHSPPKSRRGADIRRTGWSLGDQGGLYFFFFFGCIEKLLNLSIPTRDWTTVKAWSPNHWTTREVPRGTLLMRFHLSMKFKRCLLLGRKAMTNLNNVLKSRDVTLLTKVHLVKATVFPVVIYGCESWTIKKPERWTIDALELWCWRRLLRVPWTARRSNQSILKEINPEYSLEGPMLKLKIQYFGHLMWRADSLENTLMMGKIESKKEKGAAEDEIVGWHHQLNGHEFEQTLGDSGGQGNLACCSPWGRRESDTT